MGVNGEKAEVELSTLHSLCAYTAAASACSSLELTV